MVAGAGGNDLEVSGGQGQGAAVDPLAHTGEQALRGLGRMPPMTMTEGSSMLTQGSSTSPRSRPA